MSNILTKQVFDISIFEVKDGMVNLTKICQNFGKEFSNWNKTKSTKEFLFEFARENPDLPNGGIAILKGGNGEQGTFAVREIAIELARWISPKFAVWTNKQIDTLFQTGKVKLAPESKSSLKINADFLEQVAKKMRELENEKQRIIEETKPAVEFKQLISNSINSITVADFAKIIGSGEIRFYSWLRENGFLQTKPKNRPYQEFIDRGYFKVIEKTYNDQSSGESKTYFQTLITGKGQEFLAKKWRNANNQLLLN